MIADSKYGTLLQPPAWYAPYLPLIYLQADGHSMYFRPVNAVPNYTANDVLDCLLYMQTCVGFSRQDPTYGFNVAWAESSASTMEARIHYILDNVQGHDNDWNLAEFPATVKAIENIMVPLPSGIDTNLNARLQARAVQNWSSQYPWFADVQNKGGIDLRTLPYALDVEQPRSAWLPAYLPSLFITGFGKRLNTCGKILKYKTDASDLAAFMMYLQPVVLTKQATAYAVNWYINGDFCGAALANYFIGSTDLSSVFSSNMLASGGWMNAIAYAYTDDYFTFPYHNPPASWTNSLDAAVKSVISKVPVLGQLQGGLTKWADTMNVADYPTGTLSKAVAAAAQVIAQAYPDAALPGIPSSGSSTISSTSISPVVLMIGGIIFLVIIFAMFAMNSRKE